MTGSNTEYRLNNPVAPRCFAPGLHGVRYCFAGSIWYKGGMAPRQKIPSVSRWLINIGLTLQFYIPWAVLLYGFGASAYEFLTSTHPKVRGMASYMATMILIILVFAIIWYIVYLLWDRHGNRLHALCFLFATNLLVDLIWLSSWKEMVSSTNANTLLFWITSPTPLIIPTVLYIVALLLFTPKNAS